MEQEDSNRSRWKTALFWKSFLNSTEKIRIGKELPKQTIERKRDWIERQTPKSLALISMYLLGTDELSEHEFTIASQTYLKELMKEGYYSLEEKDKKLLDHAIKQKEKTVNLIHEQRSQNKLTEIWDSSISTIQRKIAIEDYYIEEMRKELHKKRNDKF